MAKIDHSESIQTTSVGKYWKSCKMAKIAHSKLFWTTLVGHSESIQDHFSRKILEKLQNGQNCPF